MDLLPGLGGLVGLPAGGARSGARTGVVTVPAAATTRRRRRRRHGHRHEVLVGRRHEKVSSGRHPRAAHTVGRERRRTTQRRVASLQGITQRGPARAGRRRGAVGVHAVRRDGHPVVRRRHELVRGERRGELHLLIEGAPRGLHRRIKRLVVATTGRRVHGHRVGHSQGSERLGASGRQHDGCFRVAPARPEHDAKDGCDADHDDGKGDPDDGADGEAVGGAAAGPCRDLRGAGGGHRRFHVGLEHDGVQREVGEGRRALAGDSTAHAADVLPGALVVDEGVHGHLAQVLRGDAGGVEGHLERARLVKLEAVGAEVHHLGNRLERNVLFLRGERHGLDCRCRIRLGCDGLSGVVGRRQGCCRNLEFDLCADSSCIVAARRVERKTGCNVLVRNHFLAHRFRGRVNLTLSAEVKVGADAAADEGALAPGAAGRRRRAQVAAQALAVVVAAGREVVGGAVTPGRRAHEACLDGAGRAAPVARHGVAVVAGLGALQLAVPALDCHHRLHRQGRPGFSRCGRSANGDGTDGGGAHGGDHNVGRLEQERGGGGSRPVERVADLGGGGSRSHDNLDTPRRKRPGHRVQERRLEVLETDPPNGGVASVADTQGRGRARRQSGGGARRAGHAG
mmetsp:Transcript_11570/g.26380  ORF Transcript_11570/g.26380 Transcript_11570/m.26380 type:complete len:625 (+) Transcript_11570:372-2246(+)